MTESQFMELREYEPNTRRWVNGGPSLSLLRQLWITPAGDGFYTLTERGRRALDAFRSKHGIAA